MRDADPEWLIIAPCGFDLERTTREAPFLETLPGWSELQAVRRQQVVLADGNLYFNRSGTTIVQTVEILAEILHGYPAGRDGTGLGAPLPARGNRRGSGTCTRRRAPAIGPPIPIRSRDTKVFTADFLRRRGYCCTNGCRHCPYPKTIEAAPVPPVRWNTSAP